MARYRKKPIEVEARQLTRANAADIAAWCGGTLAPASSVLRQSGRHLVDVPTLEGPYPGFEGEWVIRGVMGEFYPCKPDVFEASYDAVDE